MSFDRPREREQQTAGGRDAGAVAAPGRSTLTQQLDDGYSIEPDVPETVTGPVVYRVPAAERVRRRDGRLVCSWTFEYDPASHVPAKVIAASLMLPFTSVPHRWDVEGTHKVTCEVHWIADQNAAPRGAQLPPPLPPH